MGMGLCPGGRAFTGAALTEGELGALLDVGVDTGGEGFREGRGIRRGGLGRR